MKADVKQNIDIKKHIEEIQEAINTNKMITVKMEQLDHEYDINIEHIHYLSDDIAKELKKRCKDIIDVKINKSSIRIRMMEDVKFQCLKDLGYIFGINNEEITLHSVYDDEYESLYIDMIIKI